MGKTHFFELCRERGGRVYSRRANKGSLSSPREYFRREAVEGRGEGEEEGEEEGVVEGVAEEEEGSEGWEDAEGVEGVEAEGNPKRRDTLPGRKMGGLCGTSQLCRLFLIGNSLEMNKTPTTSTSLTGKT